MKKKILASVLLSAMVLSVGGQVASAVDLESAKTTGDVSFTFGEKPETIKPEEGPNDEGEDKVIEEDKDEKGNPKPLPNNGGIYVTHLPNFSFGTGNKTSLKTVDYPAYTEERVLKSETEAKGEPFFMPHSVQVSDLSGNEAATWKLAVTQDTPFESEDEKSILENSRINIYENTFTNSLYDTASLAENIKGVSLSETTKFGIIPVGNTEGSLTVLENVKTGFTNASTTSAIFKDKYNAEDYSPELTGKSEDYNGVKLNVPASDKSKAKKYTTKLTWTLTVEPGSSTENPETEPEVG